MSLASFLPIILVVHISLAIALLAPSLLLPFTTRAKEPGRISRRLLWLQSNGTVVIGGGWRLPACCLVAALGTQLLSQPWLLLALVLYAADLMVAFFVQRPGVTRLLTMRGETSDAAKTAPQALGYEAALHQLRDGRIGRRDRLPDDDQAPALNPR